MRKWRFVELDREDARFFPVAIIDDPELSGQPSLEVVKDFGEKIFK